MKKSLLLFAAATFGVATANAQSKFALYEEFSGENCGPCAAANPGLWKLLSANPSKVYLIKYQTPIPSAGPIYNQYKTISDARAAYYSVPFAPYGRLNGTNLGTAGVVSSPGHVSNLGQADINSGSTGTAPFNLTITYSYNAALDSIIATVNITAPAAYAPSGANLKLRVALVEDMKYSKAPGSNGEMIFHHVVREMYPDAAGTQLPNSWTASQNQSFTIKGKVASFVDYGDVNMVAWIQNDGDKSIAQAAKANYVPLTRDADISAAKTTLVCGLSGTTASSTFTLRNAGSTPITTAKIFYRPDGGTWASMNWTGTLAAGATTSVTTPAMPVSISNLQIIDSVGEVNGSADVNSRNNTFQSNITVMNPTPIALPIKNNFEAAAFPSNYIVYDPENTGLRWINGNGTGAARAGSNYMPWWRISSFPSGTVGYLLLPTPAAGPVRTLEFWHAYAQFTAADNDKLEVVYSTNCGGTWTSLFNKAGSALATVAPTSNVNWVPDPAPVTTDWKLNSISLNAVPAGAIMAFRGTAGGGNRMFLDDVEISTRPLGVAETILENSVSVFPNPARGASKLKLSLLVPGTVYITMLDAAGRTVATIHNGAMPAGNQELDVNTDKLASGLYTISIRSADAHLTQSLSVIK